jgi:hypothetical protein
LGDSSFQIAVTCHVGLGHERARISARDNSLRQRVKQFPAPCGQRYVGPDPTQLPRQFCSDP